MAKKINSNIFNFSRKHKIQSNYFEKKIINHSIFLKTDVEIKSFLQFFLKIQKVIINNCKLIYLNNDIYIYLSYYQELKKRNLTFANNKQQNFMTIQNNFNKKETKKSKNNKTKKTINENWKLKSKIFKSKKKETIIKNNEIKLFFQKFFIGLTNFISNKFFNIYILLEKQNKKLITLKQRFFKIKTKQKLISLKKYQQNNFFKKGINLLTICLTSIRSSVLLAEYLAKQFQILKRHNFFFRFIKNALILLNNKVFFSKIQGIKIQVKGRFNGNPRAKTRVINISKMPPFLTKSSNIEHFENTSFSHNGTFGIKVWIFRL